MNKKINKESLKQKAIILEQSLNKYAESSKDIFSVKRSISELITLAKNELIEASIDIDDVPGRYQWVTSGMSWPEDLVHSYYNFRVEISGGLSDTAKAFLLERGNKV